MRKTGGQNFSLFLSKKSGKKIMKKKPTNISPFFPYKKQQEHI